MYSVVSDRASRQQGSDTTWNLQIKEGSAEPYPVLEY